LRMAPYIKSAMESPFMAPLARFGIWYSDTARKSPFLTGFVTTGIKTSAADLFAQKVIEGRDEIDWRRQATFTIFGFMYLGGFQYTLYNNAFPKVCAGIKHSFKGQTGKTLSVGAQVFLDQAIHHPILYFPSFYFVKACAIGEENKLEYVKNKYETEIVESVKALWMVWVPCQFLNFAVVPMHFRIPFVAGVSFGWTVILSVMQALFDDPDKKKAAIEDKKD